MGLKRRVVFVGHAFIVDTVDCGHLVIYLMRVDCVPRQYIDELTSVKPDNDRKMIDSLKVGGDGELANFLVLVSTSIVIVEACRPTAF